VATRYRRRDRELAEFRAMTDYERARWVQSVLPDKFVDCPACADEPNDVAARCRCVGTRKLSKAGARAWFAEHQGTVVLEAGRDEAPAWT
jgi:hypothetical protein